MRAEDVKACIAPLTSSAAVVRFENTSLILKDHHVSSTMTQPRFQNAFLLVNAPTSASAFRVVVHSTAAIAVNKLSI